MTAELTVEIFYCTTLSEQPGLAWKNLSKVSTLLGMMAVVLTFENVYLVRSVLVRLHVPRCCDETHMSNETYKRDLQKKPTKKAHKRKSYKRDM